QKWYEFLLRDTHLEVAEVKTLAKKREDARVKKLAEEAKQKAFAAAQILAVRQAQMQSMQNMGQFGMQPGMQAGMQPGFQPGNMSGPGGMGTPSGPGGFGSKKPGGRGSQ